MRFVILLFVFFLFACGRVEEVGSLEEFDVPYEKDVFKKTYTYLRQPEGDTIKHVYIYGDPGDGRYQQNIYTNKVIYTERVFKVKDNRKGLLSKYIYVYNEIDPTIFEKLRGEIKVYEETEIGHRIKGWRSKISFTNAADQRTTIEEEGTAIKDTVLLWEDKPINAIKVNYTSSESTVIKHLPFIHLADWESEEVVYYAEGIGFIKHTSFEDGIHRETNLISIEKTRR